MLHKSQRADSYIEKDCLFNSMEIAYNKNICDISQISSYQPYSFNPANRNIIRSQSSSFLILTNYTSEKKFKQLLFKTSKDFFNEFRALYSVFSRLMKNEGKYEEPVNFL